MKRVKFFLGVLLAFALLSHGASAQTSKGTITTEIANSSAAGQPGGVILNNIVASYVDWLTCTGTGGIVYWNAGVPTCLTIGTSSQVLTVSGGLPSWASLSLAQLPVIAPNTVLGSIAGGTPIALSQAQLDSLINLASLNGTLSAVQAAVIAPTFPIVHPSSSNLVCGQGHVLAWMDQNICSTADNLIINSTDPSALIFPITIGGSKTTGDIVTLTFTFTLGAINCSAGCNASYTVLSGDTLATITTGLMNAIKANANLFNNVSGAQGIVLTVSNATTTSFSMDWNLNAGPFTLTSSVSGAATETISIPVACSTQCPVAFDVNPTIITGRLVAGLAPPAGSQISTWIAQSNSTGSPNAFSVQYGLIGVTVVNGTTGSLDSNWTIATTGASGTTSRAFTVGKHFGDVQDAAPTLTGTCGTGATITSGSTDTDGQATFGTGTPTACDIVFAHAYLSAPRCIVNRESGTAGLVYNMITTQINTAGGAASDVVNWHCAGK